MQAFRLSTNTLGRGFVEAISNATLLAIRDRQPETVRDTGVVVPVPEACGQGRIGRIGWKSQHASLESLAADAYLNEMGVTNPLFPDENTSAGRWVGHGSGADTLSEPEDDGTDTRVFADFIRATKAPSRGRPDSEAEADVFDRIGCGTGHVASIRTAPRWGLRTRDRLMHDGRSLTEQDSIRRHRGQATPVTAKYDALDDRERRQLPAFLETL